MGNYSLNFAHPKLPTRRLSTCLLAKFRGKGGLITLHALLRTGLPYTFRKEGQIALLCPFFRPVRTRTVLWGQILGVPSLDPFPQPGVKLLLRTEPEKLGPSFLGLGFRTLGVSLFRFSSTMDPAPPSSHCISDDKGESLSQFNRRSNKFYFSFSGGERGLENSRPVGVSSPLSPSFYGPFHTRLSILGGDEGRIRGSWQQQAIETAGTRRTFFSSVVQLSLSLLENHFTHQYSGVTRPFFSGKF